MESKHYTIDCGPMDQKEYAYLSDQLYRRDFISDLLRPGLNEHLISQTFLRSDFKVELSILKSSRINGISFSSENDQSINDLLLVIDSMEQPYLRPLCMGLPWARSFVADLLDPLPEKSTNNEL